MTDAEFIFREDSRKKKTIGHSAAKRVGRRKGCKFPSDYKTPKELKKMNSEVVNYNLSQPMKRAEFRRMPEDLQKQYLNRLKSLYNANDSVLGEMMGVNRQTIRIWREELGVEGSPRGARPNPEWYSFLKYGTRAREATPIKYLIPEDIREKHDRNEQEHPHVKANVERVRDETTVDETDVPIISEPAAQPGGYVLTTNDAMMLSNVHGILLAISATADNNALSFMLNTLAKDVKHLVKAWMEVQG